MLPKLMPLLRVARITGVSVGKDADVDGTVVSGAGSEVEPLWICLPAVGKQADSTKRNKMSTKHMEGRMFQIIN
jgi:hypothetical protein